VPDTGGWQNWTTINAPITLPKGKHVLQLYLDQASSSSGNIGNFNWFSIAPQVQNAARQQVLNYLYAESGNQTLVGQHNKYNNTPDNATQQAASIASRVPAYWDADFLFGDQVQYRQTMINEAMAQYEVGALVGLMYHACPPTMDESCGWDQIGGSTPVHLTDQQWKDLMTPGTAVFNNWIARLDTVAGYIQQMKNAGQAVMFRPLHEMNHCVFWWSCRTGSGGSARLYQITHDYLTYSKGLDNIIWVWNVQDSSSLASDVSTYNPGTSEYDIASLDVYDSGYTSSNYKIMLGAAAGKLIAIAACTTLPTAAQLASQPKWLYAMLRPDSIRQNAAALTALYAANKAVTLDEMPGW
jgi:beta-mannanase